MFSIVYNVLTISCLVLSLSFLLVAIVIGSTEQLWNYIDRGESELKVVVGFKKFIHKIKEEHYCVGVFLSIGSLVPLMLATDVVGPTYCYFIDIFLVEHTAGTVLGGLATLAICIYGPMYIARMVRDVSKAVKKHMSDPNAHK